MDGWELAFRFDDQTPAFANGFACGGLYEQMCKGESPIEKTISRDIMREVGRLATNKGYRADWSDLDEHWGHVTLTKQLNLIEAVK